MLHLNRVDAPVSTLYDIVQYVALFMQAVALSRVVMAAWGMTGQPATLAVDPFFLIYQDLQLHLPCISVLPAPVCGRKAGTQEGLNIADA
jgi:hypothetical protein